MPEYLVSPYIYANLSQWEGLLKDKYLISVPKSQVIFNRWEADENFYIVLTGSVALSAWSRSGKRHTIMTVNEGGIFGEQSLISLRYPRYAAQAVTACSLYRIPIEIVKEKIKSNTNLYDSILEFQFQKQEIMQIQIIDLSFGSATQRIASELLFLADSYGCPDSNGIRINRKIYYQDICDRVNCSKVTVNKVMDKFIQKGLICKEGKFFTITNRQRLLNIIESEVR